MQHFDRFIFGTGTTMAAIAVATGAFGAHVLKQHISPEMLEVFTTGSRYEMYHALALLAVAWAYRQWANPLVRLSGWFFIIGIVLFSGSLYLLALLNISWLGFITPFGGLSFLLGWLLLAVGVLRHSN